jgi:FkbM family methyltransferase
MIDSNNIKIEVYDRDAYRIKQCTFERPPKNFVDVGANVGWFTKLVDDNFQKCNIFSYELDFENFSNFQKNLNNTNPENKIFASNTAVIGFNSFNKYWKHKSNIGGHKPIFSGSDSYISEQSIDPSMLRTMHHRGTFVDVDVKKTTLWDIIKNNQVDFIDFLKLDCEGSEYEILNHAIGNDYCHKILNLAAEMHGRSFPGYNRLLGSLKNKFDFIEIKNNMLFAKNKLKGEKT